MDILKVKYATVLFTERAEERKSKAEIISINHFQLTTPENTTTYHNALCLSPQSFV